ncbi:phospholipase C/P1 nuclease family protein [Pseudomonas sp. S3_H04]
MEATPIGRTAATRYLAAFGLSLLFNPSTPAFAFNPDLHSAYALRAAQAYQRCPGVKLPEQLAEALAAGTDAEDSNLLTLPQRATNWHFYNRNKKLEPFWFANRSLDVIFSKRIEKLNALLAEPDADPVEVYEQAGRVLHYIQDMSVPGHVVPAYHAKLPGNPADPFDEFESIEALPVFDLSEAQCQALRDEAGQADATPQHFLNAAATATLQAIEQIDAAGKPVVDGAWKAYWVYPARDTDEARKGWGQYGTCEFAKGNVNAGCKREEQLVALFEQQSRQAQRNSVLMLFYVQKKLAEAGQKNASAMADQ